MTTRSTHPAVPGPAPQMAVETIPRSRWVRLGVSYLLLGAGAWLYAPDAGPEQWWVHGLWCFIGLAIALPTLSAAFRLGFAVVLTEHRVMFLAAFSLFFLFGAALLAVGPAHQAGLTLEFYPIGPSEALRVDALNSLGFGVALLTSAVWRGGWLGMVTGRVAAQVSRIPATVVVGSFLLLGGAATLYRLPFDLGFRAGVPSGLVRILGQLSLVAVFMASSSRGLHERKLRFFGVILMTVLVLAGALQFGKADALMPVAALTAGLALRFGSRKILPLGLSVLILGYLSLGTLADYGRGAVASSRYASTLMDRWSFLKEGWTNTRNLAPEEEYAYWGRLCYVPVQAASLDFWDAGRGGQGMDLILWALVPRVLAPNKPEMTSMFRELNEKITGSDTSALASGIFISGYYHGGWWGLWFASALGGWIVSQTSAIARAIYSRQAAVLLPFALLGVSIAFNVGGDFIADYLAVFMYILYPLLAAALFLPVAGSQTQRRLRADTTAC